MQNNNLKLKILAIDTSCDETAAAVTQGTKVLSNIIWSQASLHANWGGIVPSLAQRQHNERIGFVINKALQKSKIQTSGINAIAVTCGPGLGIALGVGIEKAKGIARLHNLPLIPINHVEGHLLSPFARKNTKYEVRNSKKLQNPSFPALGLVVSGGTTELILINKIGNYRIMAQTLDDALGEALDKAARMLGLGYPGGAILEKIAKEGKPFSYKLPIPMLGREKEKKFSYSGLKTALYKLIEKEKPIDRKKIQNLASSYQNIAFEHLIRITKIVVKEDEKIKSLLVGGGVANNNELRKRLRKMSKELGLIIYFPYTKKLCGDNAAMIGVAAYFKYLEGKFVQIKRLNAVDRLPRAKIDNPFLNLLGRENTSEP